MAKKKKSGNRKADWAEAKRRCRLSEEDVRLAKELGFAPRSLIKNIPSPSQPWKASVQDWVRGLYEKKMLKAAKKRSRREKANQQPAEPKAEVPKEDRRIETESQDDEFDFSSEPTEKDIRQTNRYLQRRYQEFRRAAKLVAQKLSRLPQVQRVVLFGSVAVPLQKEIPRFREFRREQIAVWHECKDVDLAVWVSDLDHLKTLQRARTRTLNQLLETEDIGVAHHQVEMFVMEAGSDRCLGRLCSFGKCPKEGRRDCKGCGQKRFLRQHEGFVFQPETLAPEKSVVLFDRMVHKDDDVS
jgi:hypothetical protein